MLILVRRGGASTAMQAAIAFLESLESVRGQNLIPMIVPCSFWGPRNGGNLSRKGYCLIAIVILAAKVNSACKSVR